MNGNANLNANNLTPQNVIEWQEKLKINSEVVITPNKNTITIIHPNGVKEVSGYRSFNTSNNGTYTFNTGQKFTECMFPVVSCGRWYDSNYACQIAVTARNLANGTFSVRIAGSTINSIFFHVVGI